MKFLRNLTNAMARFMYGRNGMDQLNWALFIAALVLNFAQVPAAHFSNLFAAICDGGSMALWVLVIFRCYSKNLAKRRSENAALMSWWWPLQRKANNIKAQRSDKDHKYFTCQHCKTVCRVPVGKGKVEITCPKCHCKISAKT